VSCCVSRNVRALWPPGPAARGAALASRLRGRIAPGGRPETGAARFVIRIGGLTAARRRPGVRRRPGGIAEDTSDCSC
jgi:hypothetical protein